MYVHIVQRLSNIKAVKVDRILDDIRDSVWNDMTREHLVTRQDILNIKRTIQY